MKLLVTGGAGFIGSTYVRRRLAEHPGDRIVVLDKLTYAGRRENLAGAPDGQIEFVEADIADREAVARAREVEPDLIVMDIQLPYVSGLELIAEMKVDETLAGVPIMAVTAYAGAGDEARIRDAGAQAYVSKPISVMKFVEVVRGLLAATSSSRP